MTERWVFVLRVLDKPGTLTAAAAVFSNRGVSLEGILGSGIDRTTSEDGRLIISFRATEAKQAMLKRALGRLSSVFQVDAYPYGDERLRAIAVAKLTPEAKGIPDSDDVYGETIERTTTAHVMLLSGRPPAVAAAIATFRQRQQLQDVVMSSITV